MIKAKKAIDSSYKEVLEPTEFESKVADSVKLRLIKRDWHSDRYIKDLVFTENYTKICNSKWIDMRGQSLQRRLQNSILLWFLIPRPLAAGLPLK